MLQGTENFWGKDLALQIMSVGSFVDDKSREDAFFQVEAITVQQVQTEVFAIVRIWKMNG